ncbi:unnamed protein product [Arabidopsis thaliana]|uniref:Uncharacterized protein n=1 Tax=Arabidopsis thaliana TaxID=3702 RepID=A0A654GD32_ARATH|nr:unnamed protein product [Arabidopsis thaliana]
MSPGQLPSDSIKVVPGRSKLRVESSNPVARGNPTPRASKVKLLSPEEAMKLTSGGNGVAVSPVKPARATSQVPKRVPPSRTPEAPRSVPACPIPEIPRPVPARPTPETPRPVTARPTPEIPRPVPARPISEVQTLVPTRPTSTAPSPVSAHPTSVVPSPVSVHPTSVAPSPVSACLTSEASKPVLANPAAGIRRELVCSLRALSMTTTPVRQRTTPSLLKSKKVEPPSPRALQIRSRVKQQAANATKIQQGAIVEVGDKAKDHGSNEIRRSVSEEELSELLQYLPAQNPTWNGRIMDSASPPEFDCEFWSKPASNIRRKALRRSKAMPALLKVELLPTCHILNDVSGRSPTLLNVEMYLFPDEKKTERFTGEHATLFKAMVTRKVMAKANINGTELLIFSSKLLDKTSQSVLINTQKKTENFLWGFFLQTKNSLGLVPETASQIDNDFDDGGVVDMDLDNECLTPRVALKLITESQKTPSRSPEKVKGEASVPPGFEKIWTPPLVKLNIQGTSNPLSDLTRSAGIVRDQSGKWVFGYIRCHKSIPEVVAGLLAIYQGLKYLWDSGFRRIHLETTSFEIINALTTKSSLFCKSKTLLGACKDMILKEWECDIYHISKEQNSCAEWLAKRSEEQPQELVFFEYPPRGLMDFLEKDRLAAM